MIFKCPICGKISESYEEIDEKHCCWWSYTNDVIRDLSPEYPINWRDNYAFYDKKESVGKSLESDCRAHSDEWMETWVIK